MDLDCDVVLFIPAAYLNSCLLSIPTDFIRSYACKTISAIDAIVIIIFSVFFIYFITFQILLFILPYI